MNVVGSLSTKYIRAIGGFWVRDRGVLSTSSGGERFTLSLSERGEPAGQLRGVSLADLFHHTDEQIVHPGVVGKFWVERGGQHVALTYRDRSAVVETGDHFDAVAD